MATWNKDTQAYGPQTRTLFESIVLAHANGSPYSATSSAGTVTLANNTVVLSNTTNVIVKGQHDDDTYSPLAITSEGHLEVAIHGPRTPFGDISVESLEPVFQADAVYGINATEIAYSNGISFGLGTSSGVVSAANNLFKCATGTTAFSFSTLQSRKRLRYRPGQGVVGRFTAAFTANVASSIVVAGYGTAESGLFFGYNGNSFGILHSTNGFREIQELQVTTPSTGTQRIQVTLNGNTFQVGGVTSSTTTQTAYQISIGNTWGGIWTSEQRGANVVFLASSTGNNVGSFSIAQAGAGTPAAGSFTEKLTGKLASETWVPQSQWNGDRLNGTGKSGVTLDPSKGNVYQIDVQYLGFGAIVFKVEAGLPGNNPDFVTAHTFNFPNSRNLISISQPSFPYKMAAYSSGSTADVSVQTGSFAGFISGKKKLTGPRMTYERDTNNYVSDGTGLYYPLFTVRNALVFNNRANQSIVNLLSFSAAHDDMTPITFFALRNAKLTAGLPNFQRFSPSSCTFWDFAATLCTIQSRDQLIFSTKVGQGGTVLFAFEDEITIQPGETITIAARAVTSTAPYCDASLNTREDQ